MIRVSLALSLVALLAACAGGDHAPATQALCKGWSPASEIPTRWLDREGDPGASLIGADNSGELALRLDLREDDWRPGPMPGLLELQLPCPSADAGAARLEIAGVRVPQAEADAVRSLLEGDLAVLDGAPRWSISVDRLLLAATQAPPVARLWLPIGKGHTVDGRWRERLPGIACDGLPLTAGTPQTLEFSPSSISRRLRFTLHATGSRTATIRVRVDHGTGLASEVELRADPIGASRQCSFDVPPGTSDVVLQLIEGRALVVAGAPILTAAERADDERPDLIVVLADTLRADMLAAYRDRPLAVAPMPLLDSRAGAALVFTEARSNSSWTLPSQGSLLTGLPPLAHGAIRGDLRIADEAPRLARRLRDAGYRTVAITEGSYVSSDFGMDRGFELFDERSRDVDFTVARALEQLRCDDPRPLFLYVQTYRAHSPYRSPPTSPRAELVESWPTDVDLGPRFADPRLENVRSELGSDAAFERLVAGYRADIEQQWADYLGGVHALDRSLAPLFDAIQTRDAPSRTVFTSDHGEEFGEHGTVGHGQGVWDVLIRVPMLVWGDGVEPGVNDSYVTLIDLAPSLTEWASLPAVASDRGQPLPLRGVDESPRAAFAWTCATPPHSESSSIVAAGTKWIELDAGGVSFTLADDPAERVGRPSLTPPPQVRPWTARFSAHSDPSRWPARPAELNASTRERLKALGYVR
jgi:arylsulfatase A-like enzyme